MLLVDASFGMSPPRAMGCGGASHFPRVGIRDPVVFQCGSHSAGQRAEVVTVGVGGTGGTSCGVFSFAAPLSSAGKGRRWGRTVAPAESRSVDDGKGQLRGECGAHAYADEFDA